MEEKEVGTGWKGERERERGAKAVLIIA